MSKMSQLHMELCEIFNVDDIEDIRDMHMGEMIEGLKKAHEDNPEKYKRISREAAKRVLEKEAYDDKVKRVEIEYGKKLALVSLLADRYSEDDQIKGYIMIVDDGKRTLMVGKGSSKWYKKNLAEFTDRMNDEADED